MLIQIRIYFQIGFFRVVLSDDMSREVKAFMSIFSVIIFMMSRQAINMRKKTIKHNIFFCKNIFLQHLSLERGKL